MSSCSIKFTPPSISFSFVSNIITTPILHPNMMDTWTVSPNVTYPIEFLQFGWDITFKWDWSLKCSLILRHVRADTRWVFLTESIVPIYLHVILKDWLFLCAVFEESQYQNSKRNEPAISDANQANNPPWLPWKLSPYSANKMRLFVNLFPQFGRTANWCSTRWLNSNACSRATSSETI